VEVTHKHDSHFISCIASRIFALNNMFIPPLLERSKKECAVKRKKGILTIMLRWQHAVDRC